VDSCISCLTLPRVHSRTSESEKKQQERRSREQDKCVSIAQGNSVSNDAVALIDREIQRRTGRSSMPRLGVTLFLGT
jgi:hypothetical protein